MGEKKAGRENWIDAAKAAAIFIVLLNHSGLWIPGVNFWGGMFYVPAFFLLSGYTYRPKAEPFKRTVQRKAKRLLAPYFTANALLYLFFLLKDLLTGTFSPAESALSLAGIFYGRNQIFGSGLLRMSVVPEENIDLMTNLNAPTWFLPALFVTVVTADGLYRLLTGKRRRLGIVLTAGISFFSTLWMLLMPVLLPFSLDMLGCFLLLFFTGYAFKAWDVFARLEKKSPGLRLVIWAGIAAVAAGCGLYNGSSNLSISDCGRSPLTCLMAAVASTTLLLGALRFAEKKAGRFAAALAAPGRHTLAVLCYHYFIMQMFFALAGALAPGMPKTALQLAGIVVSGALCVAGDCICAAFLRRLA